MKTVRCRGFTIVEVMIVGALLSVLAAIGLPKFLRAQKQAQQSEAISNLKSLHVGLTSQAQRPTSIHAPGFDPKHHNRYSYHLSSDCLSAEDRGTRPPTSHAEDDCIGVDTFSHPTLPALFTPMLVSTVAWDEEATMNGMQNYPGIYGGDTHWDYLAYAAGDLDDDPNDMPDTWLVSSADAGYFGYCSWEPLYLPAGEPFQTFSDTDC